jgi:hypothetical protein
VHNEAELRALAGRLKDAHIEHRLIIESDAPYTDQAMAIGIKPMDRKLLNPFLSSYALVAQPGRASRVMTSKVGSSNLPERSTSQGACSSSGQSVRSNDPQGTRFDS